MAYPASLLSLLQGSTIVLVNSIKNISFYFCSTSVGDALFRIRAELAPSSLAIIRSDQYLCHWLRSLLSGSFRTKIRRIDVRDAQTCLASFFSNSVGCF